MLNTKANPILKFPQPLSLQTSHRFKEHNCCVIIPTYNNEKTLKRVVEGVLGYCEDVIVVNDGATDSTNEIISSFGERIVVVEHEKNIGKGMALRNGFKKAIELGFDYAITIDSDGQHFPENLTDLLDESIANPEAMIMGARNMEQDGVPGKSSFGNKFSNFWFLVETGIKMPDTQTGYRLYPLNAVKRRKYFTRKFEFEIEVIVKLAWMHIPFKAVPVNVLYDPDERVSHFRPFRDFTRISILNTYLVTLMILWHFHVRMIRKVWKKGLWNTFKEQWNNKDESNFNKAVAVGFGFFMGIIPIWGFQMLVAAALAKLFRLNVIITLISSNISIPPMIPLILFACFWTGALVMDDPATMLWSSDISLEDVYINLKQYVIGSVIFATIAGLFMFLVSLSLILLMGKPLFKAQK